MIPWWVWAVLGVLALAGESISTALFLLNVGIAAFVAAVLAYLQVAPAIQVGVFVVLSLLLIGLARPRMMQALLGHAPAHPLSTEPALVGRIATVTETVSDEGGEIRIGRGEFWSARTAADAAPIVAGSRVRITRLDGLSALVEPLPALDAAPAAPPSQVEAVPAQERVEPAGDPSLTCGALLRRYRQAAGLTQEDLAERAGLSVRAISDLERGLHRSPQRDTVRMLADALNLSPDERAAFEAAARRLRDPAGQPGA